MRKKGWRATGVWTAGIMLYVALCRTCPPFAGLALARLSRPAMLALHRLTARVPFPASELLAIVAVAMSLCALPGAMLRAVRARRFTPIAGWLRRAGGVALALAAATALLWCPPLAQPVDAPPVPDTDRLEWLCGQLVDRLNAAPSAFPPAQESLRRAPEIAGLAGCAVKAVRYPEWMRAASISGLFVPLTGEALVDAGAPEALVPFTAVHELMHLNGIADEGAANIAAWERCMAAGGAYAASARLWALRYAMGLLRQADTDAWRRVCDNMKDPLSQVFQQSGGESVPGSRALPSLPGLTRAQGDYADLVGWLAARGG